MSRHPIPPDIDSKMLLDKLARHLRTPALMYENQPENPPTAVEFTPDLTAGETTTFNALVEGSDPDTNSDLRALILPIAQSSVGVAITALTTGQIRALVACLLYEAGALDGSGVVRPLNQWLK